MEVRILHLYYDLLNLYGEYANMSVLTRRLEEQGVEVTLDRLSVGDEIDFGQYDFIYTGSGTESAQLLALADLAARRDMLVKTLETGTIFLATGNSFELFGKQITDGAGNRQDGLALFDFGTVVSNRERTLCDQICTGTMSEKPFVGFINKASEIHGVVTPMFTVTHGAGNAPEDKGEGIMSGSFYGTHLTGPCLVKNPHLVAYFVRLLAERLGFSYCEPSVGYEEKAYEITLEALRERFGV